MFRTLATEVRRQKKLHSEQEAMDRQELEKKLHTMFCNFEKAAEVEEKRLDSDREALRAKLESFFTTLGPTLSGGVAAIQVTEERARAAEERRTARRFTAFGLVRTQELDLSRIFAGLLNPAGDHAQGDLFLSLFLEELQAGSPASAPHLRLFQPPGGVHTQVHLEYPTGRQTTQKGVAISGSIDIVLELHNNRWIGIENKPWAIDQLEQVERYRDALLEKVEGDKERVVILYWSGDGSDPTLSGSDAPGQRGPTDFGQQEAMSPWGITMPYRKGPGTPSLEGWLKRCWVECEPERVRSFLGDVLEYVRTHFRSPRSPRS